VGRTLHFLFKADRGRKPLPEIMERLDCTRITSVARARMKDKFGARIYLHRGHGTFRVVTADGSMEPGSDNPETAPTLAALLKRTKWDGFKDNNQDRRARCTASMLV
jgi:hypothetical protein